MRLYSDFTGTNEIKKVIRLSPFFCMLVNAQKRGFFYGNQKFIFYGRIRNSSFILIHGAVITGMTKKFLRTKSVTTGTEPAKTGSESETVGVKSVTVEEKSVAFGLLSETTEMKPVLIGSQLVETGIESEAA